MLTKFRRLLSRIFNKSSTINSEPLNKVSLIVIILIDIFILINVFTGLDDISRWHLSPSEAYPCYAEWQDYQTQPNQTKDYDFVRRSILNSNELGNQQLNVQQSYQQVEAGHLGKVAPTCLKFASYKDAINTARNRQTATTIEQKQTGITKLEQANRTIRSQYDSTLLEKLAGQPRDRSINAIAVEEAKQQLGQNDRQISALQTEITALKRDLVAKPESAAFISLLKNNESYQQVKNGYQQASFWYPAIQLILQSLFLLPLILIAATVHNFSQRRNYGLIALISWHLLIIFFVPLIFKVFEFLRVNVILDFILNLIGVLFGGLLFLVNYVYILLIPLIGFGIIKFFQRVVFNAKVQASGRIQKSRCVKCAKRIRPQDAYCPHCSYYQYVECQNCHNLTYKHLSYCRQCGHAQDLSNL